MNWKITQIEVSNFKAFKYINLNLGSLSLLTLDGPNGFGKTSIFDALELLLTGQVKRIQDLFSTLMKGNKKNYDDSLLWNIRSTKRDLLIKVEFINDERRLVLARHASVEKLEMKSNNRADKFDHFCLYELPDFESQAYTDANKRDNQFLDEIFGVNFRENFSFLNYLAQGQNKLLHTRVDERKDQLGNLFNTSDIAVEIENCRSVEAKLTKFLGDQTRKAKEASLDAECAALRKMIKADLGNVEYKKISTVDSGPSWDKESPFLSYDEGSYTQCLESIRKLSEILPQKAAIRIRADNENIESDIKQHDELLGLLAKLGTDIGKLDDLDGTKNEIDLLTKATSVIKKGASVITAEQARTLPGWLSDRLAGFELQITKRDNLQAKNTVNESAAAELARLKQQLLEEHATLYPDDNLCPLCGCDWKSYTLMFEAVEDRAKKIGDALSEDGRDLVVLIASMTEELSTIERYIQEREATLKPGYSDSLHKALIEAKTRLPTTLLLSERLRAEGIQINFTFSDDEVTVAARLENLRNSMRAKKTNETVALPDDWRQVVDAVFKDLHDLYIFDPLDLKNKELYIKIKANEAQSGRIRRCVDDLQRIRRENDAANKAKDKVIRLRTTLVKAEQKYADQTISEIELIFHIYSGRLIQNYQRGLGLFIESRDGKQLRFMTAEKSDHDAVMSMSTGQVSALSLAFFLSLNKVYADVPLILIDDPSQSLDDVNIASMTDLLRCELSHCQLVVSSHEEDISAYMRYRFERAGLTTTSLNMQRLAKEVQ